MWYSKNRMAYETIVSNTLKQERGQFFTHRNIIRFMVEMLDPDEKDMVLDLPVAAVVFWWWLWILTLSVHTRFLPISAPKTR